MNNTKKPIGIFDSGIGGLTLANAINKIMPGEQIIYFGDTAHTPWGNQSEKAIQEYSKHISNLLIERDCKAIIIACNTASASATSTVTNTVGVNIPVFNVITPVVNYITENYDNSKIGIIGTKRTINSNQYPNLINNIKPNINIIPKVTSLLAPIVEEINLDDNIKELILKKYLLSDDFNKIDALVLGCTHYPLLLEHIKKIYKENKIETEILDPSKIVAKFVKESLNSLNMLNTNSTPNNNHKFLVSAEHAFFNELASNLFKDKVEFELYS